MRVIAWEVDPELTTQTKQSLTLVSERFDEVGVPFEFEVRNEDFLHIIAGPLLADALPECPRFGIENHVNYLHSQGAPLDRQLAIGLAAFLNHEVVDVCFRSFSGHTQVNAADLRRLRFPDLATLKDLGSASCPHSACDEWIRNFASACGISGTGEEDRALQTSAAHYN